MVQPALLVVAFNMQTQAPAPVDVIDEYQLTAIRPGFFNRWELTGLRSKGSGAQVRMPEWERRRTESGL